MSAISEFDTIVIGGGVVGMSVAYGLVRAGERVRVLDQGDDAFRAARGNFGLVWVQGKGLGKPDYARWTLGGARMWPSLAANLLQQTGIDVQLSQIGGLVFCLSDDELTQRAEHLKALRDEVGENYPFEVLDADAVRKLCPNVGPEVIGATFSSLDGHVSPLRLLQALVQSFQMLGGDLCNGVDVMAIDRRAGVFQVNAGGTIHTAAKLVLAAGLGNRDLAPLVGMSVPVKPVRGQVLITERVKPFLSHPTFNVRQTGDGGVQIGDSKEDVGFDDGTSLSELSRIADRARRQFPLLNEVNVVRSWGALRVMTPDGYPLYETSSECPGAFVVTCHSGVTLAARHAGPIADWVRGGSEPAELKSFKAERFHV